MFFTSADMQNGYYGKWQYSKNNNAQFIELGKEIVVDSISRNIETGAIKLNISFEFQGMRVQTTIDRAEIGDSKLMTRLAGLGADVTKQNFDVVIDTLRIQEEYLEANGVAVKNEYDRLGWIQQTDSNGKRHLCYRADTIIGWVPAKYTGDLKIKPMGSYETWKHMIEAQVLGHPVLELALLIGLSAVVNGLISTATTGENPIIHLCSRSGTGKSTAGILATSVFGEPFNGKKVVVDSSGITKNFRSVYGTWGATPNATITQCAGNNGCIIVLNELGKFIGSDMTPIIYNLSEGTDKQRLTKDLQCNPSEGFRTTILSLGEFPILDKCKSKVEGLNVRVLEIDTPVTDSAEQADEIKRIAQTNNGWAAPMMAEYILNNGGIKAVVDTFNKIRTDLLTEWPETPSRERFVSKFPALFLTTAKIAEQALGIAFGCESIKAFLIELDSRRGVERNTAASSYEYIIEKVFIHKKNFFVKSRKTSFRQDAENNIPSNEIWGRITYETYKYKGRTVVQEIEIVKSILEKILDDGGYLNRKACIAEWKKAEVLDYEDNYHATRTRKIDPGAPAGSKHEVYVLRVFATAESEQEIQAEENTRQELLARRAKTISLIKEEEKDDNAHTA